MINKKLQMNDEVKPVNIGIEGNELRIKNTFKVETFKIKLVQSQMHDGLLISKLNQFWNKHFQTCFKLITCI